MGYLQILIDSRISERKRDFSGDSRLYIKTDYIDDIQIFYCQLVGGKKADNLMKFICHFIRSGTTLAFFQLL